MDELKNFKGGGMDYDSAPEAIAPNDYREAFNIRTSGTAEGEDGYITNIESTEEITTILPAGINKVTGGAPFKSIRKGIGFRYNSTGKHQIFEIDFDTDTETVLFENLTDSGNQDVLQLDSKERILDIKLIGDKFLAFLDGKKKPCLVNYQRLKAKSYGIVRKEDFSLIKAQGLVPPKVSYNNDATRSVNLITQRLFQFRYQWEYLDNEQSAHSTISKRLVPVDESTPAVGTDVTKNNNLLVTVPIGSDRVKRIIISARYETLDWFIVKTVERADILNIPSSLDVENEIYESYSNGFYTFAFYNDGLFNNIPPLETDLTYDHIPTAAESLEVLNGSNLALAGLTEGYDRPEVEVRLGQSSYKPDISVAPPDPTTSLKVESWSQYRPSGQSYRRVLVRFQGKPKTGDKITIITSDLKGKVYNEISRVVTASEENNLLKAIQGLASVLPYPSAVEDAGGGVIALRFTTRRSSETPDGGTEQMKGYEIDLANVGSGVSRSTPGLKTNSSYQLALAHFDENGAYFPLVTDKRFVLKTQSYSQLRGLSPKFNWEILNDKAPQGAVSYQWLISENTTHQNVLWVNAKIQEVLADYIILNINSLKEFNEGNSSSILNYDDVRGDRVTFHYYNNPDKIWFDNPSVDVEVVGFEIKVDTEAEPDETNYLLKVRKSASLDTAILDGKNMLIEIYTPKKRTTTSEGITTYNDTVFYEIGEQFNIVDGKYTVTSGEITDGDIYFKSRQLENAITDDPEIYEVEDFNFSDFYPSRYTSYGRQRLYSDTDVKTDRKASIRYSDPYLSGSLINGLTRFYKERIYGDNAGETSSNHGWIRKIRQRGNYLIVLQETQIGHIGVYLSIVEDQASQQQIAVSDKILDKVRYISNYGIGRAKESYAESQNGTIYFIDPNNSLPVRDGYDGVQPIAGKMSKYFKRVFQQAYKAGKKTPAWFDDFNNEYVPTIEQSGDIIVEVRFDEAQWKYQDYYNPSPNTISISQNPVNGIASYNSSTGKVTYTPNFGYVGADNLKFIFNGITKNICLSVTEGNSDVFDFTFVDVTDAELSTIYESNTILVAGNNVPVAISIIGGEYSINGAAYTNIEGTVEQDDIVQVRATSSPNNSTTVNATLTIGSQSDTFSILTKAGDFDPNPFSFTDVSNQPLSTWIESNTITISGLSNGASVSVSSNGGDLSKNGGGWVSSSTAQNGDTFKVRVMSSGSNLTSTSVTLIAGGVSDTFTVTTLPADLEPDQFTFIDVDNQETSTVIDSNEITLTGITGSVSVSVANGEYSKNGGAYTSTPTTAVNGDKFRVRRMSSANNLESVSVTLTAGNVSDTFTITTMANQAVACGAQASYNGGEAFPSETSVILGSDTGTVTLTYDSVGVPDKFEVWFDGVKVIDTGYRGSTSNQQFLTDALAAKGLPSELIQGPASGTASFVKSTSSVEAIVKVYAPIVGTAWTFNLSCPQPVTPPPTLAWRVVEDEDFCAKDNLVDQSNIGYVGYWLLEQYNVDTNEPTGLQKTNGLVYYSTDSSSTKVSSDVQTILNDKANYEVLFLSVSDNEDPDFEPMQLNTSACPLPQPTGCPGIPATVYLKPIWQEINQEVATASDVYGQGGFYCGDNIDYLDTLMIQFFSDFNLTQPLTISGVKIGLSTAATGVAKNIKPNVIYSDNATVANGTSITIPNIIYQTRTVDVDGQGACTINPLTEFEGTITVSCSDKLGNFIIKYN